MYPKIYLSSYLCRVFSPPSSDDEMKDLLLQRRFRMLNWLEPKHLDVPLDLHRPEVQEEIIKGQQGSLALGVNLSIFSLINVHELSGKGLARQTDILLAWLASPRFLISLTCQLFLVSLCISYCSVAAVDTK